MASGALMLIGIELTGIVAKEGIKKYLEHRREMIANNQKDKLLTTKINNLGNNIYRRMSKKLTNTRDIVVDVIDEVEDIKDKDVVNGIKDGIFIVEDVVEDAGKMIDLYNDEKSDDDANDKKTITETIMESMKPISQNVRRSSLGINAQRIKDFVSQPIQSAIRSLTPSRRKSVQFEDSKVDTPNTHAEFDLVVKKIITYNTS
jgi:hypothetical protein